MLLVFKILFLFFILKYQAFCFTRTNFVVKNVENCDKKNRSKLSFVVKTENGKQYTDFDVTLANALDETVRGTSVTESSLDGKSYLKLLQFSYKDPCKNANKYLGEFWYDALRACQLPPGACPIPKRHYHVQNHFLDYSKISIQTFPFGRLRFTHSLTTDDKPDDFILCLVIDLENKIN